jgi:hypothetical protein
MGSIPSPPKKRSKPLLLEAPSGDEQVSEANKFVYKASGSYKASEVESSAEDEDQEEDEEDEFEKMVCCPYGAG